MIITHITNKDYGGVVSTSSLTNDLEFEFLSRLC